MTNDASCVIYRPPVPVAAQCSAPNAGLAITSARAKPCRHDNSAPNLDAPLNPSRGTSAPLPFFLANPAQRADMVEFLRAVDTSN